MQRTASKIETYYLAQDGHPNAYQNLLVAKELKRRLLSEGDVFPRKGVATFPMKTCSNESMAPQLTPDAFYCENVPPLSKSAWGEQPQGHTDEEKISVQITEATARPDSAIGHLL